MNFNSTQFEQIVQQAFDSVSESRRWQNAIVRAKQIAESNPYIHMDGSTMILLSDSNEIYEVAEGRCVTSEGQQCKAFAQGQPCKHRALRRLMLRYNATSH